MNTRTKSRAAPTGPSPFAIEAAALPVEKFSDPEITAKGEPRAHVPLTRLETLWFNTGTLCNLACASCYIESSPTNDALVYIAAKHVARFLDKMVDRVVSADRPPDFEEPAVDRASAWPELVAARRSGQPEAMNRYAPDRTFMISAAVAMKDGTSLLATENARDITRTVRAERFRLGLVLAAAVLASVLLSLFLARTIVQPLQRLARAAVRVRLGRAREVTVPRLPERRDEIGMLARSISDMTAALRQRIDAVEHFAADVAHEIKNPLASLRSATESLAKVEDPKLRGQLIDIAIHDVRRIDRLVTEISDASRIDAEMSRTEFEPVDLAQLLRTIVDNRETRDENEGRMVVITGDDRSVPIMGVPARLERVIQNLLDNAVSFSPPAGRIVAEITRSDNRITLSISDEGPGIPEEKRERVFQRFHSDRPEEEDFGNHSGLGLAIARTIAEAHDGTLVATSRADGEEGACLQLSLPAKR